MKQYVKDCLRILNTTCRFHGELNQLSGSGIAEAYNGEYIRWNNNNDHIAAGTQDANQVVKVDSIKTSKNGKVYYLNGLLTFTDTTSAGISPKLGTPAGIRIQSISGNIWKVPVCITPCRPTGEIFRNLCRNFLYRICS